MKPWLFALLGVAIVLYAAFAVVLGEGVQLVTIVFFFGLLVIPYLALEWVVTPLVAVVSGIYARWSIALALAAGLPLVLAFTIVTPVVSSGNSSLPVPVPWLSNYSSAKSAVVPIIRERLTWWISVYTLSFAVGLASRAIRPPRGM
jgi:hypothetical protein